MKDNYKSQVNLRNQEVLRFKDKIHKISKVEDVINLMGCKGPEVMKMIEAEDIKNAVYQMIAQPNNKIKIGIIKAFEMPKLEGLRD